MRWNYYKLRQLSLLQSAMNDYYKLRYHFYYKVRHGLLQIGTGITKCDTVYYKCARHYKVRWTYYKLRQVLQSAMIITNCDSTAATDSCFALLRAHQHSIAVGPLNGQSPFRIKGPFEFWSLNILFVSKQPIRFLH